MRSAVVAVALLSACGDAPPSPSAVTSARFLALLTDSPEVRPGDTATVTVLWVDPAARAVSFSGWWCWEGPTVDPLRCEPTVAAGPLSPGETPRAWVAGPLIPPIGAREAIVVVEARVEGERSSAFRRVGVRTDGPLHVPPELRAVTLRQGEQVTVAGEGQEIRVTSAAFSVEVQAETATEAGPLMASFFASAGAFSPPRAVSPAALVSRWIPGGEDQVEVWVLLRDARGGVRARTFRVRRGD
jgi:hypothetical protein